MDNIQIKTNKVTAAIGFGLIMSLSANALLGSLYYQSLAEIRTLKEDPQFQAMAELDDTITEVSKLISLPQGVVPILATVNNADELRDRQTFFANAENGDKMLLYSNATNPDDRKAYLYRPSTKQLINVAVLSLAGQIQAQEEAFSIVVRNGTTQADLGNQMQSLIGQIFPNAVVASVEPAANTGYTQSVLVNVGGQEDVVSKVATLFNIPVVDLPAGEVAPSGVDMLLILGFEVEEGQAAQPAPAATTTPAPAAPQGQ